MSYYIILKAAIYENMHENIALLLFFIVLFTSDLFKLYGNYKPCVGRCVGQPVFFLVSPDSYFVCPVPSFSEMKFPANRGLSCGEKIPC